MELMKRATVPRMRGKVIAQNDCEKDYYFVSGVVPMLRTRVVFFVPEFAQRHGAPLAPQLMTFGRDAESRPGRNLNET